MALHPEMSDMEGLRAFASASQNMPTGNFGDPKNPVNAGATYSTPSSLGAALGAPSAIPTITPVPASMAEALNSAGTAPAVPGKVNASGDYTPPANTDPNTLTLSDLITGRKRGEPIPPPSAKTVVRTGTQNGRKVVQYSDGTIDYAN